MVICFVIVTLVKDLYKIICVLNVKLGTDL